MLEGRSVLSCGVSWFVVLEVRFKTPEHAQR